ncbi:hypothetical protein GCM10010145_51240 [Streptomyces ruber]|uniref:Uncharacterized protein n=2 Tax=Streptomyces TaxID=1883 RepID=A0A918BLP0_9ACTN|nr:hypothetical protein [Streptomyces ruber]GGQ75400.1 hypothetical protein GCM10010145_51240 [Streptomyces ruber]
MKRSDDHETVAPDAGLSADGPHAARPVAPGGPRLPREHRRTGIRLALVLALAAVVAGAVRGHGLLLAAGLVATSVSMDLLGRADRRHREALHTGRATP